MKIIGTIRNELENYFDKEVPLSENVMFSQHKLVKRIALFDNQSYGSGKKVDAQGKYKYWFEIIAPRVDTEIKNVDFDTKDIRVYSDRKNDAFPELITNASIKTYLRTTGQAEEFNEMVEEGAGWGNLVAKKVKGGYELVDLKNFYVINQTARTLNETPVIERHTLTASQLRAKEGTWDRADIGEIIRDSKNKTFSPTKQSSPVVTEIPYFEAYERNGEVSLAELKEAQGQKFSERDADIYVLARVIVIGLDRESSGTVVFAEKLSGKMSDHYKEYHRGRYKGRWFREGLIELLMDCQVRANELGNQIARGLEWSSKQIFRSEDIKTVQNVMTYLKNGDIIRSKDLQQVEVRMQGFDQLMADWNRNLAAADAIANSREITQGEALPSGMPFRLGALLNLNANKLFDFIREKLGLFVKDIYDSWILPQHISDLKKQDIIRFTGDAEQCERLYEMAVKSWYVRNLIAIGPHSPEVGEMLQQRKMEELKADPRVLIQLTSELFEDFKPHAEVLITGEQVNLLADLETLQSFITLEQDPVRRQALIELAMRKKGIDAGSLPKSPPAALVPPTTAARPTSPALTSEAEV